MYFKQVEKTTGFLAFSLVLNKIPLCGPKNIPTNRDISIQLSLFASLHFKSRKAHIVSIHI